MELKSIQEEIWDLPLPQLIKFWDGMEKLHGIDAVRELCLVDRFYLFARVCRRSDVLHPWLLERCREVERNTDNMLDLWAREHYKDLADSTPILTSNRGWTTHGDLAIGDIVFAPSGKQVKVIALSPKYSDSKCYKVTFSDDAEIIAGAGHLWKIRIKYDNRAFSEEIISTSCLTTDNRCWVDTRFVKKIEKIQSVPTRCIQVEGGMYLAGKELIPTHNSSIITYAGAIQEILKDPEITIAIFSHTKGIARKFFRQIKYELESNTTLHRAFPDILYANPQKESQRWAEETGLVVKRKSNPKESTLEAWGLVDGQPTSAHFKLRIYDDVVAPESVTTPEQISKTTAAWELSDNLGTVGGRKWHVGTRYHFGDTYNAILERGALKPRIHAATDNGQPDGNPVLLTQEQWDEKKVIQGPATIACQQLQNPIAGQQAMFDVNDLQTYEVRPQTLNIYILVDPARSMKKGSANTAIAVIGVDTARNKYLLDGINHRLDLKGRWEAVRDMRRLWINKRGVQGLWVGYEAFGAQADLDYFKERMEVEQESFAITELKWPRDGEGSKDDRVQRLGPDLRSKKFFLPLDTKTLTTQQERCKNTGQEYRISKPIRKRDSDGNIYDLSKMLKEQVMFYPFAPLKDLIDATSRIYDMDARPPVIIDERELEPEATVD